MDSVQIEDITVPWGAAADPLDVQNGRWRMAVYQDCEEGFGGDKLYFLYDPVADERSGTTGSRNGDPGLVVFDCNRRFFIGHIPLYLEGIAKFSFVLKTPSPANGSTLIIVTECDRRQMGGSLCLVFWRVHLGTSGLHLMNQPEQLLNKPVPIFGEYIIALREDLPELVVMTSPGLTVWRIPCLNPYPSDPVENFQVPQGDLAHFYDATVSQGTIYFHSSSPDGHYDPTRIHILPLSGGDRIIRTQTCQGDYRFGCPCARKEVALNSVAGFILAAGGEFADMNGVHRLNDCWVLDIMTYAWRKMSPDLPLALIEPRISTAASGNIIVWGESDEPFPGVMQGTHVRILRVKGMASKLAPPSYGEAFQNPNTAPNPTLVQSQSSNAPYGAAPSNYGFMYPNTNAPYPSSNPSYQNTCTSYHPSNLSYQTHQGDQQQYGPPDSTPANFAQSYPNQNLGGQQPYYPPENKKDCCIQ